jgi:hypothetical protein
MIRATAASVIAASLAGCDVPAPQQTEDRAAAAGTFQATDAQAASTTAEVQAQPQVIYVPQPIYVFVPQPEHEMQATWADARYQSDCGLAGDCGSAANGGDVDVDVDLDPHPDCPPRVFGDPVHTRCY